MTNFADDSDLFPPELQTRDRRPRAKLGIEGQEDRGLTLFGGFYREMKLHRKDFPAKWTAIRRFDGVVEVWQETGQGQGPDAWFVRIHP